MKKDKVQASTFEALLQHPNVLWIIDHARKLCVLCLLALLVLVGRLFFVGFGSGVSEYAALEGKMVELRRAVLESDTSNNKAAIAKLADELEKKLKRLPQLQPSYDGPIAQLLIVADMPKKAQPFAERAWTQLSKHQLPLLDAFSRNSLFIADKEFAKALGSAQALEQKLSEAKNHHLFYTYTLLQEAALQKQLGLQKEETHTLENLKRLTHDHINGMTSLLQAFALGTLSLNDYVKDREQKLGQRSGDL